MTDHTPRTDEAENETDGLPHDEADAKLLALARTLEQENLRLEAELAGARWEAKRAFELLAEANRAIANVTTKVREVHEAAKRGERTGDHGLDGNLSCLMDHVLSVRMDHDEWKRTHVSVEKDVYQDLRNNAEYAEQLHSLVDRALKMMVLSGYAIAPHDADHNNPVVAWMAEARAAIAQRSATGECTTADRQPMAQAPVSPCAEPRVEPLTGEKLALRIRAVLMAHRLQHTLADDESGGHRLVDALTMPFDETIKTGIDEIDILAEEIACHLDDARVENIPEWAKDCGQFPHCSCWPGRCVSQNAAPEEQKL